MARMNRILALRPADRCAVVQPGVLNGDLQQALQPHGLFWPPDPSSAEICSVGGNLSTNAGGPRAVKYGATRDNVLGLVAVTGTGDVIHCGGAYTKIPLATTSRICWSAAKARWRSSSKRR